jgi:transcription antitermination protein NusB
MAPEWGASRHQSRERALSLLYEAEMKAQAPREVLDALAVPPDEYCVHLVSRCEELGERADGLVESASIGWPLDRMAVVDRLVLRLATVELMDPDGPPPAVVIDEAVELAKVYSTEESGRFVNGVLSAVAGRLSEAPD